MIKACKVVAVAVSTLMASGDAFAEIIEGYPDAIVCRTANFRVVGYLHRVNDDGTVTYMTLGDQFATVTPDGIFHRDGAVDCDGKSLEQLEQDGQTRNFWSPGD